MGGAQMTERLRALEDRGVQVVDPRQTWIGDDVQLDRVCAGAILHPQTRLHGAATFVSPGAQVGVEGPATLVDAVLGPDARVDAGYVSGAVLLSGARAGFGAHFRPGTLLEEHASTAHTVGLKQTILLSFVTLGSLINFCDVLMAGGTSRADHSEVGSGFIHFNFTPWGERGDKATPSLVGDVVDGVLLRQRRIFLGGAGGMIGPTRIGYGAITGAGQVLRDAVEPGRLVVRPPPSVDVELPPGHLDRVQPRLTQNLDYIGQLAALRAWYRQVRLARVPQGDDGVVTRTVLQAAVDTIEACLAERVARVEAFLRERGEPMPALSLEVEPKCEPMPALSLEVEPKCPLPLAPDPVGPDHITWVQSVPKRDVSALGAWLREVADAATGPAVGR